MLSSENSSGEMGALISSPLINQKETESSTEAIKQKQQATPPSSKAAADTNELST